MIDVYHWPTPNGHKVTIFLEEAGLPYRIHSVDIGKGEQFKPEFLKIAPNNRIPAIVDNDPADGGAPISLFESGAILLYLAEKTGRLMPDDAKGRSRVLQWLMFQMASFGPTLAQARNVGSSAPDQSTCPIDRDTHEARRLVGAIESASEHPIAVAITAGAREEAGELPVVESFTNREGSGVEGIVDGRAFLDRMRGVTERKPLVLSDARALFRGSYNLADFDQGAADSMLQSVGMTDPLDRQIHTVALARAVRQASGA